MKTHINLLTVFFLVTLLVAGCSGKNGSNGATGPQGQTGSTGPQGPAGPTMPVIQSLSIQGVPAIPGSNVTTTVAAQSAQGLALTYTWTTSSPWILSPSSVNSQTATITAPSGYGMTGEATIEVSDTQGRYAIGVVALSTQGSTSPVIGSISAFPDPVIIGGTMALLVSATGSAGDTLSYTWQIPNGWTQTWTSTTGNGITITAPDQYNATGTVNVTVFDNDNGSSATGTVLIGTTTCEGTVTDHDGNVYPVVAIGTQCWMEENLSTTTYNDGTPIAHITDDTTWSTYGVHSTGAYCLYGDDGSVSPPPSPAYGLLYNWYAVSAPDGLCPTGWHVPTDAEWETLGNYLGGDSVAGGALKETGTTDWWSPNTGATNSSGFTALPGGYRDDLGTFLNVGYEGYWWSATENKTYATNAWYRYMVYYGGYVNRSYDSKAFGFSVRCVRDY